MQALLDLVGSPVVAGHSHSHSKSTEAPGGLLHLLLLIKRAQGLPQGVLSPAWGLESSDALRASQENSRCEGGTCVLVRPA